MKFAIPSRADARDLSRREKMSITFLMNATSSLADAKDELNGRLDMIDGGHELMDRLVEDSQKLLTEVRKTIPERQRTHLANTANDFEMRLVPKMTPAKTSVVMQKEEFRELVNAAQVKCRECLDDGQECKQCKLYQLLTVVLPMDEHEDGMLCPYNMAEWGN